MSEALQGTVVEVTTDRIAEFCREMISRHSANWPVGEEDLASEFVAFFDLPSFLSFEHMVQFCRTDLQIPVSIMPMPDVLRGFNGTCGRRREIVIAEKHDFHRAKVHTLLHELREILEGGFETLGRPTASTEGLDPEERAEDFAIGVQIAASHKALPVVLDTASGIERKWLRIPNSTQIRRMRSGI